MAKIGIYGVSSQSGAAYFADLVANGVQVYGYARPSLHGRAVVEAIREQDGMQVDRPSDAREESSHFVPLLGSEVGHDLERLARDADVIILAHPANYHESALKQLANVLRRCGRPIPLVLSPSRTLAVPYCWEILGDDYPIVSFQTCPYACKSFRPGAVHLKNRKRAWIASIEGRVVPRTVSLLRSLFPQIVFSRSPAATSLGNMGAVFHPTAYILNLPAIHEAEAKGCVYSFYQQGIAHNPRVGPIVEEVDQIRLRIAEALGCPVFGLRERPREDEWQKLMGKVDALEANRTATAHDRCLKRARFLQPIHDAVVSGQHWLAYTYGVERVPGESLASAIGRTPNFLQDSVPQTRYADEDVATGLVPLEALASRLRIDCAPMTHVIDEYIRQTGIDAREHGRNLRHFDLAFLRQYLRGEWQCLSDRCAGIVSSQS